MTEQDAALVDQLRYTHEWGIFQAQGDAMLPSFEECADRIEALSADVERLRAAISRIEPPFVNEAEIRWRISFCLADAERAAREASSA